MRPGYRTTEFWLAAKWIFMVAGGLFLLLHHPPQDWHVSIAAGVALAVMSYMAGAVTNNYGENRFQLKARGVGFVQQQQEDNSQRGPMGFHAARLMSQPVTADDEEEGEGDE